MMRLWILGFIICQIGVELRAEEFQARFPQRFAAFEPAESRYRSIPGHRGYSDYNDRIPRKEHDLPITLNPPPPYETPEFRPGGHEYRNRRTFFEDFSLDKTTAFPGLYRFMSSIFGGGSEIRPGFPQDFRYDHPRGTPSYELVTPFAFGPTEPNYIPPPKPIRASVIKLETITRPPSHPAFEYGPTTEHPPHLGPLINHVLIESSKPRPNVTWLPRDPHDDVPPFKPLPVLPRPAFVPPTTLRPTYPEFPDNRSLTFRYYNKTDYKYPESVQDQLPYVDLGDAQIPYETEKSISQIFNAPTADTTPPREIGHAGEFLQPPEPRPTANLLDLIDIRSLNPPRRRERPREVNVGFDTTTAKSFPGAVEKVNRPTFKYTKKLTAQLEKSPVERVTNLTVLGFSNARQENAKRQEQVNYLNVRKLINYEMHRFQNVSPTDSSTDDDSSGSSMRPVNLSDDLSLDAKILKDTNWDGFTVPPPSPTAEATTYKTLRKTEPKPKLNGTAFWEAVEQQSTTLSAISEDAEVTTAATGQTKTQTTTEVLETSEPITVYETTPRTAQRRSENFDGDPPSPATDDPEEKPTATSPFPKKKYSRRPKTVNFTPYPAPEDLQRKLTNRSYFPKRPKPNITLAFGNKNVLRSRESSGNEEVMKFSDEDVRKRRKIGKRRHVIKRIRLPTSPRPNQGDSLLKDHPPL